ncbi:MAG: lysozyme inhibitor LprI family protein [Gallionella sp.]
MKRIGLISLVCLTIVPVVQAASFDCRNASSVLEKTICADSEISSLDETLAKSYSNAINKLSPDGKVILRDGQRRWLRHVTNVCLVYKNSSGTSACTKQMYKNRIKDMETAAIQSGPFVFSRIDYFFSKRDDVFGRPFQGQTSYPRIDSPLSETGKKWNAAMARKSKAEGDDWCDGRPGDIDIDFVIKSATENIISAQLSNWMYCHGAAHGYGGSDTKTFVLTPQFHLLHSGDLFASDRDWAGFLADRSFVVLDKAVDIGRSSSDPQIDRNVMRKEILAIVSHTGSWSFTKDALVITFGTDTVIGFGYAGGEHTVTIPWEELNPYLAPNNPIFQAASSDAHVK